MAVKIERTEKKNARIEDIPAGTVFDGRYNGTNGPWIKTDEGSIVTLQTGIEYTKSQFENIFGELYIDGYVPLNIRVVVEGPEGE